MSDVVRWIGSGGLRAGRPHGAASEPSPSRSAFASNSAIPGAGLFTDRLLDKRGVLPIDDVEAATFGKNLASDFFAADPCEAVPRTALDVDAASHSCQQEIRVGCGPDERSSGTAEQLEALFDELACVGGTEFDFRLIKGVLVPSQSFSELSGVEVERPQKKLRGGACAIV
jgi:hypothetical protein